LQAVPSQQYPPRTEVAGFFATSGFHILTKKRDRVNERAAHLRSIDLKPDVHEGGPRNHGVRVLQAL